MRMRMRMIMTTTKYNPTFFFPVFGRFIKFLLISFHLLTTTTLLLSKISSISLITIMKLNMGTADAWTAEWIDLTKKTSSSSKFSSSINPPRSGHVAFVDKNHDVFVFGGYAEETIITEDHDEKKEATTATATTNDHSSSSSSTTTTTLNRYPTNDLWKFDATSSSLGWKKWIDPQHYPNDSTGNSNAGNVNIDIPQQRLAAAAAYLPLTQSSFIFGGWDPQEQGTGGVILNDIWEYTTTTGTTSTGSGSGGGVSGSWKGLGEKKQDEQDSIDLGQPTSRLVAVTISEDTILLHNHRCTDHVMLFVVKKDGSDDQKTKTTIIKQPTTGTPPSPRGLHAAVCIHVKNNSNNNNNDDDTTSSYLIVFGGAAQDGNMSNEVFALDLSTWEWTPVEIVNNNDKDGDNGIPQQPSPRASPCFAVLDDNNDSSSSSSPTCILFGGADKQQNGATFGLHGCDDLWLLHLKHFDKSNNNNDSNNNKKKKQAIWEKVSTTTTPPGRNAATLMKLSKSPFPTTTKIAQEEHNNDDDGEDSHSQYFLLSGGWFPFRTTFGDNYVLKMTKQKN